MTKERLIFYIINVWFGFIALLLIAMQFPHWPSMNWHGLVNEALYFLLFLLSLAISMVEPVNKDIYVNLSVLYFIYAFSFVNIFIGEKYIFGSDWLGVFFFVYKTVLFRLVFTYCVVYMVLRHLFSNHKRSTTYWVSLIVLLPVFVYNFYPLFQDIDSLKKLREGLYTLLYQRVLLNQIFSLIFMAAYGIHLLRTDRIVGHYINSILAVFFIFLTNQVVTSISIVYDFNVYSTDLIFLTLTLLFFGIVLLRKLFFVSTDYGKFYETLIQSQGKLGKLTIRSHNGEVNSKLLELLKQYFIYRRNYLFLLFYITGVVMLYLRLPKFSAISIIVGLFSLLIIAGFIFILHQKRKMRKYLFH